MGAEILAALTAASNTVSNVLEPVTSFLGGADTATSATTGISEGLHGLTGVPATPAIGPATPAAAAIKGTSKALGQIAGIGGQAMKAVPVATALASAKSKPKTPKIEMPSGPTDTAIARSSTRAEKRGQGASSKRAPARRKAGYSSFG